ncbi:putative secreted RxLR effector protein [Phytophthora cinnamomi]|uniref:putative secreted RxLR effector protein n=1 Tax=Phytophthora cinnamomi TaxID=4785 RepID=UPI0035599CFD|nr:putative secreted RxLR effector protein [Phytophthora cinnamomi]
MGLNCIAVLVAVAFVTCANSASTVSKTIANGFQATVLSNADNDKGIPGVKRLLREVQGEETEESGVLSDPILTWNLNRWLNKGKFPSAVLVKLKLNGGVGEALVDKHWNALVRYVDMFSEEYPNIEVSLVRTLAAHYGEDVVAKALVTARQSGNTAHIATSLQRQQFEDWLNNRKSGDDVFELLKIGGMGIKSMDSRALVTLDEYLEQFKVRFPRAAKDSFTVLRDGFGEAAFAGILADAKLYPVSRTMLENASKYQEKLFTDWSKREHPQPLQILSNLFGVDRFADANPEVKLVINNYNAFYKRHMAGQ